MIITNNLKRYLKLYKMNEENVDNDQTDIIAEQMEELYYKLDEDELAYLEEKQII